MRKPIGKVKSPALKKRLRRKLSIRKKVGGTASIPRVCITKSNKNLAIQVIDDEAMKTLLAVQTFGKSAVAKGANKDAAKVIGEKVAEGLKAKNITKAVFDRSGYKYHGVVAVVADTIRENGVQV